MKNQPNHIERYLCRAYRWQKNYDETASKCQNWQVNDVVSKVVFFLFSVLSAASLGVLPLNTVKYCIQIKSGLQQ